MAIQLKELELIIGNISRLSRKIVRGLVSREDKILSLDLSFGVKEKDADGNVLRDPDTGGQYWNTTFDKTLEAKRLDVMDFAAVTDVRALVQAILAEDAAYREAGVPAAICNLFLLDSLSSTPLEAFARWMLSQDRWRL